MMEEKFETAISIFGMLTLLFMLLGIWITKLTVQFELTSVIMFILTYASNECRKDFKMKGKGE